MTRERRAMRVAADLLAMQRLAARFPTGSTHATDLPYRLTTDGPADDLAGIVWEDADGSMVGWAIWIPGNWGMECAADPAHAERLYPEMIAWGDEQAAAFARGRAEPTPHWWLYAHCDDNVRI